MSFDAMIFQNQGLDHKTDHTTWTELCVSQGQAFFDPSSQRT